MRLLSIAIFSILLFFGLWFALEPLLGSNWAAGIAAFMMYIGFPILFLLWWQKEWEGPVIRVCNYIIAFVVLAVSLWVAFIAFSEGRKQINAILFFLFYGGAAMYFIAFGRFHIQLKSDDET